MKHYITEIFEHHCSLLPKVADFCLQTVQKLILMHKVLEPSSLNFIKCTYQLKHNNKRKAQNYKVLKCISFHAIKCAPQLKSTAR